MTPVSTSTGELARRLAVVVAFVASAAAGMAFTQPVNQHAAMLKAFRDRVDAYVALHRKVEGELPALKETSDPTKIAEREKLLGESLARARRGAKPGEIFDDAAPYIVKTIRDDWRHRSRADRAALLSEMPKKPNAGVNSIYPSTVPLLTFPPALLQALPPLPEGLEYRFFGRDVILRDVKGNLIVDIVRDVIPTGPTS
jgi:hypothetical protein